MRLAVADRAIIERQLGDIAWTLSLRQWVSDAEAEEVFELVAAGYRVSYRLEPEARLLRVTALEPLREDRGGDRKRATRRQEDVRR
jgi:hypothetical protein